MERASRRSAVNSNSSSSNSALAGRRRRRDASAGRAEASQSEDSDSSSRVPSSSSSSTKRDAAEHHRTRSSRRSVAREGEHEEEEEEEEEKTEEAEEEHSEPENESSSSDKPARRERSLSNVSTTSSTSSGASEPLSEGTRHVHHAQKLSELEQKRKMVEDGTLAEYCRRVTEFKEDRNRLLQMAEWHKNLQLTNGKELHDFEIQRAEHLWLNGKKVLRAQMIDKLDAVRAKILRELEELAKPGANPPWSPEQTSSVHEEKAEGSTEEPVHVSSDSTAVEEAAIPESKGSAADGEPAQKKRKLELHEDLVRLSFDDISADLSAIAIERMNRSETANASLPSTQMDPMKVERRRLFCGKNIFQDGDEVAIVSPIIKEDYVGKISSVTDEAVYVHLSSGQKVRIYMDLIKTKRCELKPLLRGLPALVEYESY